MIQKLCVCGLGKLGSCVATAFAGVGIQVIGYDIDSEKVQAINWGRAPVQEPGLSKAIEKVSKRLKATTDPVDAVRGTEACIFVAPTPSLSDGSFDNQYLLAGIEKIAAACPRDSKFIFVIASTVTPGSCEKVLLPAIRKYSSFFELVYKPELIALGTVLNDLAHPDVALIGSSNEAAAMEVFRLYSKLQGTDFKFMSFVEAELAKISLNCAVTMKISFANQVGMVAQQYGASPKKILDFVGSDGRIGKKALRFGMSFGGPCFPRDGRMFRLAAEKVSIAPHLATATDAINQDVLQYIFDSIPCDGDVGILGLAYKSGTCVTEESAGLALKVMLTAGGRTVKAHDPLVSPQGLKDAAKCRTVIVTTDCAEYRGLTFSPEQFVIDPMGVVGTQPRALSAS